MSRPALKPGLIAGALMLAWPAAAQIAEPPGPDTPDAPALDRPAAPAPGPFRLIPGGAADRGGPRFPTLPDPPRAQPGAVPEPVEVRAADAPGLDSAGALTATTGGYGADLWAGSDRATLGGLFARLPVMGTGAELARMQARILATAARMPGARGGDPDEGALLQARAEALMAAGRVASAEALIASAGANPNADMRALAAQARLYALDLPGACALGAGASADGPFWRDLTVLCRAVAGDAKGAELGLNLLRGQADADPWAMWATETLIGLAPGEAPDADAGLSAVGYAGLRVAGARFRPETVAGLPAPVLAALARDGEIEPETRLMAAEEAARLGAIDADILTRAYRDYPFPEAMRAEALSAAEALAEPAEIRALLVQAALDETLDAARAELIGALARRENGGPMEIPLTLVLADAVAALRPGSALAFFASDATRLLLLAGRPDAARAWRAALVQSARLDPALAARAARLWGLKRLALGPGEAPSGDFPAFADAVLADGDEKGAARLARLALLRMALGDVVPPDALLIGPMEHGAALAATPATKAAAGAGLALMRAAADAGRRGETGLAASLAAAGRAPGALPDAEAAAMATALAAAGFAAEARGFALEAMTRAGL